jgi:hypothetical protein
MQGFTDVQVSGIEQMLETTPRFHLLHSFSLSKITEE